MVFSDVVDQFHDDDSLAHARAAEQPDLAALQKRLDEVDHLHPGLEHFRAGRLLVEGRRETVNRHSLFEFDRAKLIDRLTNHVHHAPQRPAADRHRDWSVLVNGLHAAHHAVGGLHGDAAHAALTQVLLHLENHADRVGHGKTIAHHFDGLIDRRQLPLGKLNVHRRARDLNDMSYVFRHNTSALDCWLLTVGS